MENNTKKEQPTKVVKVTLTYEDGTTEDFDKNAIFASAEDINEGKDTKLRLVNVKVQGLKKLSQLTDAVIENSTKQMIHSLIRL